LGRIQVAIKHDFEHFFQGFYPFFGKPMPPQSDSIQTVEERRPGSCHPAEGKNILSNDRTSADERIHPDPAELMNSAQCTNGRKIFDDNMATDRCPMEKNNVAANNTIMGDMGISHEVIAIPYDSLSPTAYRAPMNCHEFPKNVALSDLDTGILSFIRDVLRLPSDGRKRRKTAPFSYLCLSG
jgi:hypothetical protein